MSSHETRKPRQKTLDGVFNFVKNNKGANRIKVMTETNHEGYTVKLCLDSLVASGRLLKQFVRMSGPYKVYSYAVNE